MTGKKTKLAWVENDKSRAITLKGRREGLLQKVKELTILCDILACLIIFSPNEAEPVVWPSTETVRGLLDGFFALPKFVQKKKETDVESFLKEKTKKVHEKLMKNNKKNKEYVTNELMMQLQHGRGVDDLNLNEIYALLSFSKENIMLFRKKLGFMEFSPLHDPFEVQVEQLAITTNNVYVESGQGDDNNPIMAINQPTQYPFDFMSRDQEIQEEGNNIDDTTTTNDDVRQESPPNEANVNLSAFNIDNNWLSLNNRHF